jgi:hypothetical protein
MPSFVPNPQVLLTKEQERLWSNAIGGLILNCSQIEFASVRWVEHFARDPLLSELAIDMQLSRRLQIIRKLVERSELPPDAKKRAIELWREVGKLSEIRNTIAHSPFIIGTTADGKPAAGILNVRDVKGSWPRTTTLLQVRKIIDTALALGRLSGELDSVLVESHR